MPLVRQGPGLIRGVARTAVIAGTASAVQGRVARRQAARFAEEDAQVAAAQPQAPQPAAAAPTDTVARLQQLAELKAQGAISDQEFDALKAKVLAG
jgi:membrane protease subunit (stomatin/prohibitin family)